MRPTIFNTVLALAGISSLVSARLAAQSNLTAVAIAPTTVALSWTGASGANGYWIQRGVGTATLASINPAKISGTTYTDLMAPAGTALRYRIRATYPNRPHTYSDKVSVTTPTAGANTAVSGPIKQRPAPGNQASSPPPPGSPITTTAVTGVLLPAPLVVAQASPASQPGTPAPASGSTPAPPTPPGGGTGGSTGGGLGSLGGAIGGLGGSIMGGTGGSTAAGGIGSLGGASGGLCGSTAGGIGSLAGATAGATGGLGGSLMGGTGGSTAAGGSGLVGGAIGSLGGATAGATGGLGGSLMGMGGTGGSTAAGGSGLVGGAIGGLCGSTAGGIGSLAGATAGATGGLGGSIMGGTGGSTGGGLGSLGGAIGGLGGIGGAGTAPPGPPPAPVPTNLRMESAGPVAHTLSWNGYPVMSYKVEVRTPASGGAFQTLAPWGGNQAMSYLHAVGVQPGTEYRVTAKDFWGQTGSTVYVYANPPQPEVPTGFVARQTGPGQVSLKWDPVPYAKTYRVFGTGQPRDGLVASTTEVTLQDLPDGDYSWQVTADYGGGVYATGRLPMVTIVLPKGAR